MSGGGSGTSGAGAEEGATGVNGTATGGGRAGDGGGRVRVSPLIGWSGWSGVALGVRLPPLLVARGCERGVRSAGRSKSGAGA